MLLTVSMASMATSVPSMGTTTTTYAAGRRAAVGGVVGEEECEVEDREWSVAVIAAAANANPQSAGSVVLDKMPGGRLMREYESIIVASASSSPGNNDDDRMLIYDDFDGGNDFDDGGGVGGLNEGEYGGVPRAADALSGALTDIANSDDDNNDEDKDEDEDRESCDVDGGDGVMSSDNFDGGDNFDDGGEVGGSNEGEYGGVPRAADALSGVFADIANSDDDDNNEDEDKDRESCDVDGSDGVMSSPSCLDDKLSSLLCLNNDKLNVFDIDDILVESFVNMLMVDDANKRGKDEKDNDDDDANNNDDEHSSLLTTVPNAT